MFLSNSAKNLMLDQLSVVSTGALFGSLHSAYSTTGTNELTGGSPAYFRQPLVWAAASGGAKALVPTLPTWNVPLGGNVVWWGGWTASSAGTFLFMMPVGAGSLQPADMELAADLSPTNQIFAKAHGLSATTPVVFWGAALPSGLIVGNIYYVLAAGLTTNSFSVSSLAPPSTTVQTLTGTVPYGFFVQSCAPESFGAQGTYSLGGGSIDLSAVA